MATILLSAAGAALGSGFGGTVLGLSGAVIGRAVGATVGRNIDQRILGGGSEPVESGRIDRFRLTGASEGSAIPQVWGRMRIAGQVIWATRFEEIATDSGGTKGVPRPVSTSFAYTVSLAIGLCEGEATRVGRIWADGVEISPDSLDMRFYPGSETQLPDPKIEAVEGAGNAPAFRGISYVVMESLDLSSFGNRIPQFSFEVLRRAQGNAAEQFLDLPASVRAVCMIPGTGEYALGTTPEHFSEGPGNNKSANVNTVNGKTDMAVSMRQLREELPLVGSVSLVVSWFGSDLRCGQCSVKPKVEQTTVDGAVSPWRSGGIPRAQAQTVPQSEGRSVYGGTPSDISVIEAIAEIRSGGQEVMFYPFILMDQLTDNGLPDPWSAATNQPVLPWRGRITLSSAPGQAGSPDRTATATAEVASFFGTTVPGDFSVSGGIINYAGPDEWKYRRFILHNAHLCAMAGGVDAFCIGSEMRGLTQIRGAADAFPAVAALRQLAAEVREILGSNTQITYAADWSEYFGYHADGNVYFHLDPLWADANIDFVGIDNYMPISDWRDGETHADSGWGSLYNVEYLKANIAGGEGFDWYYDGPEGEAAQVRKPITDGAFGEDWVFRYKDIRNWWANPHYARINGVRSTTATAWIPQSKPIRFTEYGCAALDKGTNQPNKFLDAKSSESGLPRASNGHRDDFIQMQYLRANREFWTDPQNNPMSAVYSARMLDSDRSHVWAWDARPFPDFPGNFQMWGDGDNYLHGHWLNGRSSNVPLAALVTEICERSQVLNVDSETTYAAVRGFTVTDIGSARSALQPLSVGYGVETVERDGMLKFSMRSAEKATLLTADSFALSPEIDGTPETTRAADAESTGRVRIGFVEADGSFDLRTAEAVFPDEGTSVVSQSEMPLLLTGSEARAMADRWLAESRVARDTARFALPMSMMALGVGDIVQLADLRYRIDRVEQSDLQTIDAVRVDSSVYRQGEEIEDRPNRQHYLPPLPVFPLFMDLPLLSGQEVPYAPHVAVTASPWPGPVAVWSGLSDAGYTLNHIIEARAVVGITESGLSAAQAGVWDHGEPLRVRLLSGGLSSVSTSDLLNGLNVAAIGDGCTGNWEIIQFADANLVAPATYELKNRLRGQAGSDGIMPAQWPVGSYFVLLNGAVDQIDLESSARGLERYYRVGLASLPYNDSNVVVATEAFDGIGLRPYSVSHLKRSGGVGGNIGISWIRRTRIDGDSWVSNEVPLGEDTERYLVRVVNGTAIVREVETLVQNWTYTSTMQSEDGATAAYRVSVGQMSDRFGLGPTKSLSLG